MTFAGGGSADPGDIGGSSGSDSDGGTDTDSGLDYGDVVGGGGGGGGDSGSEDDSSETDISRIEARAESTDSGSSGSDDSGSDGSESGADGQSDTGDTSGGDTSESDTDTTDGDATDISRIEARAESTDSGASDSDAPDITPEQGDAIADAGAVDDSAIEPEQPETPAGAPPDPQSGPSPDTQSDGPGVPDADREIEQGFGVGGETTPIPISQTTKTTRAQSTIKGARSKPLHDTVTDPLAGAEEEVADTLVGRAIGSAADATAEAAGRARSVVGGTLPLDRIQESSSNASETVQSEVTEPAAGVVGRYVETLAGGPTDIVTTPTGDEDKGITDPRTEEGELFAHGLSRTLNASVDSTVGLPANAIRSGRLGADVASAGYETVREEGAVRGSEEIAGTTATVGTALAAATAQSAKEDPVGFSGSVLGGVATGVVAGKGLGIAGRGVSSRVSTVGARKFDLDESTQREVIEGDRQYPAARDGELYGEQPDEAVRRQAEDMTPDEVQQQFEDAGVDDGVVLKKALDTDPEGPGPAGFRTQTGDYESPGAFVGPELSPYFLGTGQRSAGFSLRPGLPDVRSGQPTGVFIKTDVEQPRSARNLDELDDELREREGDTTAVTKPASEVNEGEIESIIPPDAEFADVKGGPIRNTLRRFGIGSDFYTEVDGRRVPIRTVAPADEIDRPGSPRLRDLFEDTRAQSGGRTGGSLRTLELDDFRGSRNPVDRPFPTVPSGDSPTTDTGSDGRRDTGSDARDTTPPTSRTGGSSGDSSAPPSSGPPSRGPPSTPPSSGPGGSSGSSGGPGGSFGGGSSPGGSGPPSGSGGPTGGGSSGGPSGGSPGSPGSPGGSGSSSGGSPSTPPSDPARPRGEFDFGSDKDDEEKELPFAGASTPFGTDFYDPLTGNVLETNLDEPEFERFGL